MGESRGRRTTQGVNKCVQSLSTTWPAAWLLGFGGYVFEFTADTDNRPHPLNGETVELAAEHDSLLLGNAKGSQVTRCIMGNATSNAKH